MVPFLILFEDAEALVVDKPAGLDVSRPRRGGPSLEDALPSLRLGFARPPAPVHRLDRDTSGCLLLARHPKALARFGRAFEQGAVEKRYLAVLAGEPEGEEGAVELPLLKVSTAEGGWRIVADPAGKPARTEWRVLERAEGRALVLFAPRTGRTHQIRVHAAAGLGAAVAGDPVYGSPARFGMLLHAAGLRVPREGKPAVDAASPLPERFGVWAGRGHEL